MLVFNRKVGEKVVINDGEIEVKVLPSQGNTIRLGFKIAKNMEIKREEDFLKKILPVPEFLKVNHA